MSKLDNRPAAVVTGANRGLGLELCRQLQAAGWRVVALCRRSSPELEALGVSQMEEGVDVGSDACVALLRQRLAGVPVGLLICNAGVLSVDSVADLDTAVCREQFEVNALGPLRVVHALQPNLQQACSAGGSNAGSAGSGSSSAGRGGSSGSTEGGGSSTAGGSSTSASSNGGGSKVAIISSKMGSIAATREGGKNGSAGYRLSKAAANMAGQLLALELQPLGIPLVLIHPGAVATDMYRNYWAAVGPGAMAPSAHGAVSPQAAAAAGVLQRIEELTLEGSGRFVQAASGEALPW